MLESAVHLPDAPLTRVEAIGWLTTDGTNCCQHGLPAPHIGNFTGSKFGREPIHYALHKIGFLSNNPPVYDLLPKAREAIEKFDVG